MIGQQTRACWQPWESLNVAADGKVYPCCVVHTELEVGDLNHQSLPEIIAGEPMLRLKRKLLIGEYEGLICAGCPNAPIEPVEVFQQSIVDRYISPERPDKRTEPAFAAPERVEPTGIDVAQVADALGAPSGHLRALVRRAALAAFRAVPRGVRQKARNFVIDGTR